MTKSSFAITTIAKRVLPLVALACSAMASEGKADDTLLSEDRAVYDRLVRLEHPIISGERGRIIASATNSQGGVIFKGDISGTSFSQIGTITDPQAFAFGFCCSTLYELPRRIGDLRRGTLLWAVAVGGGQKKATHGPFALMVYQSQDEGKSWSHLSDVKGAGPRWLVRAGIHRRS